MYFYKGFPTEKVKSAVETFQRNIEKQEINSYGSLTKGLCKDTIDYVLSEFEKVFGDFKE